MKHMALLAFVLFAQSGYADTFDNCLQVEEEDGSPSNVGCQPLHVPNGSLTDNSSYYSLAITNAATATALAADPANCSAGSTAGGVTAAGVAESCLDPIVSTEIDTSSELDTIVTDNTGSGALAFATAPTFSGMSVTNPISFDSVFYYNGSTYTDDTTTAKTSGGSAYSVLVGTSNYFYVGSSSTFTKIYFDISVASAASRTLAWEYSKGSGSWGSLTPVTDGTTALTADGTMTFSAPGDWATDTVNSSSGKYWVRISESNDPGADPTALITIPSNTPIFQLLGNSGDSLNTISSRINGDGIQIITQDNIQNPTILLTRTGINALTIVPSSIDYSNSTTFAIANGGASRIRWDTSGNTLVGDAFNTVQTAIGILSINGEAARTMGVARRTTSNVAGNNLTVVAGGATSGATNKSGGNLTLTGGISTGSGTSSVLIQTYPGTAGSTTDNTATTALTIDGSQNAAFTGTVTSSRTTDFGWSVVAGANTACNTTCTSACVFGFDAGTPTIVDCADATADKCLCAGAN